MAARGDDPGRPARRPVAAGGRRSVTRRAEFAGADTIETTLRREHDEAAARLSEASAQLAAHEAAVASLSERTDAAQQTWFRLSALAERVSATVRIASERAQHLDTEPVTGTGPDPDVLEAQAGEVADQERRLLAELEQARTHLEVARAELAEKKVPQPKPSVPIWRQSAPRPIVVRVWPGWLAGSRPGVRGWSRSMTVWPAWTAAIEDAATRTLHRPKRNSRSCRAGSANSTGGEVGLDEHHDRTVAALRLADGRVAELRAPAAPPSAQVASLQGIDALAVGLERRTARPGLSRTAAAQAFSEPSQTRSRPSRL